MSLASYDLDAGTPAIECAIPTVDGGREVTTELIDFDGRETIVTSDCDSDSASLHQLAVTNYGSNTLVLEQV